MLTKVDKRYIYKYDESAIKTILEQMLNDSVIIDTDEDTDTSSEEAVHNMEHPYDLVGDEDVNKLKE